MAHLHTCTLCEALCGIEVKCTGDRVGSIRGDPQDPLSRGFVCPKATALGDLHHDPDRLRTPLLRDGSTHRPIGWDEALDLAARRLLELRSTHGRKGVAMYVGNPTVHNLGAMLGSQVFGAVLGSHNRYSATSVDQLPKMLAAYQMFGHQLLMTVPDIDRTDLFVILGANPMVSNGSLMSAPGMRWRLGAIKARGGRVVVFDPRRTETARVATEHHFIRPGTDALLLFSMLHVVFAEGLVRLGRLARHVTGLDELRALAMEFSPEATAGVTGVSSSVVRALARDVAHTERAAVYGRVGVSVQTFGGLACWLIEALNAVTGHLDEVGGMMFATPAVDLVALGSWIGQRGSFGRIRSRVRGAPGFGGELPVACLAEEITTPGEGQVRALVTLAGNPVLSTPDGRALDRALASLDFMVSIDPYLNETTRHAHLILPPVMPLEREHYDLALYAYAVRNVARWSEPLFVPGPDQRTDWEILTGLARRMLRRGDRCDGLRDALADLALRVVTPRRVVDLLLRLGPYGYRRGFRDALTLDRVIASRHGVDLGPLRPVLPARLFTPDRRVHLAPREMVGDVPRLREAMVRWANEAPGGLVVTGRRELRSNNSWCHNSPRLVKGPPRCTLRMHPDDARARGIATGDRVQLRSRVGTVLVSVELTDEMMRGVVSLPHGWGHDRPGVRLAVASAHAGVSLNDVTDAQRIDALCGTASLTGVPVEVLRVDAGAQIDPVFDGAEEGSLGAMASGP
jgi:anaerobic selenocysteine-containing dehydrogenase